MANPPSVKYGNAVATNAVASVTLPADSNQGRRLRLLALDCGYDLPPAAGSLITLKSNTDVIYQLPITSEGAAPINPLGFMSDPGETLVAELSAGGSGVKGYVNVSAEYY